MYQERRDALCNGLREIGWDLPNGKGTMFVWARIPGGRTDSMAFCMELMEKAGVIVTPGASFGPHGEGYVRFALVLPPEENQKRLWNLSVQVEFKYHFQIYLQIYCKL